MRIAEAAVQMDNVGVMQCAVYRHLAPHARLRGGAESCTIEHLTRISRTAVQLDKLVHLRITAAAEQRTTAILREASVGGFLVLGHHHPAAIAKVKPVRTRGGCGSRGRNRSRSRAGARDHFRPWLGAYTFITTTRAGVGLAVTGRQWTRCVAALR